MGPRGTDQLRPSSTSSVRQRWGLHGDRRRNSDDVNAHAAQLRRPQAAPWLFGSDSYDSDSDSGIDRGSVGGAEPLLVPTLVREVSSPLASCSGSGSMDDGSAETRRRSVPPRASPATRSSSLGDSASVPSSPSSESADAYLDTEEYHRHQHQQQQRRLSRRRRAGRDLSAKKHSRRASDLPQFFMHTTTVATEEQPLASMVRPAQSGDSHADPPTTTKDSSKHLEKQLLSGCFLPVEQWAKRHVHDVHKQVEACWSALLFCFPN